MAGAKMHADEADIHVGAEGRTWGSDKPKTHCREKTPARNVEKANGDGPLVA